MTRFHARTAEQIFDAARQGTQFDPAIMGSLDGTSARYQQLRADMSAAYAQGCADRHMRQALYDASTIAKEHANAIKAYELATTEPAISYTIGYAGSGSIPVAN
jgi:hypothetical protein